MGDKKLIAAGHESGTVRIWDLETMSLKITFHGHKSAVSCLKFNKSNNLLISGGRDCNVVVWDIIGEMGLYRLQGHKDMVKKKKKKKKKRIHVKSLFIIFLLFCCLDYWCCII